MITKRTMSENVHFEQIVRDRSYISADPTMPDHVLEQFLRNLT